MRDGIKQTGKYLYDTGKRRDIALRRVVPIIPVTERIRDIFDADFPTEMEFKMPKDDTQVHMDIRFLPPLYSVGNTPSCGNCHCHTVESFYGGETEYSLTQDAITGTVYVYINGASTANFTLISPQTVEVNDSTTSTDKVSIAYVYKYSDQCDEGEDVNYTGGAFAGLQRSSGYIGGAFSGYGQLGFSNNFDDDCASGWNCLATQGPLSIIQTSAPYTSILVEQDMIIRIKCVVQATGVYFPATTARLDVSINGGVVDTTSAGLGPGFASATLSIDLRDQQVYAGDIISVSSGPNNIFWTNSGVNITYLKVGRGSFPSIDFEGP